MPIFEIFGLVCVYRSSVQRPQSSEQVRVNAVPSEGESKPMVVRWSQRAAWITNCSLFPAPLSCDSQRGRDRQLGLQLPLICRKAPQLWSCQESKSQSLSLIHTQAQTAPSLHGYRNAPPREARRLPQKHWVHIYTQGPPIFFHLSSCTNTRTHIK